MTSLDRRREILSLVRELKSVSIQKLQVRLDASPATLRRDLAFLESERKIIRTHGGAALPEYVTDEPSFSRRQKVAPAKKWAIGQEAAQLDGLRGAVFVDSGTTCLELGKRLFERGDLRVYTNSLPLLTVAANMSCEVVSLGGTLRPASCAMVGGLSREWLRKLHFDWAFIGASGLSATEGCFTTEPLEAEVKANILNSSTRRVLLCDSDKWQHPSAMRFARWNAFDTWVVDSGLPETEFIPSLTRADLRVIRANQTESHDA